MDQDEYRKRQLHLASQLKAARQEAKITQVEAGKMMGKDQTFISKVESGRYVVDAIQIGT